MSEERKITGSWSYLKAVLFKPTWEFATVGGFFTLLFVGTWWRDNFASEGWKKKLELKGLLPDWHPSWWLCIALVVLLCLVIRSSYGLWRKEYEEMIQAEVVKPLPETAPEFEVKPDTLRTGKLPDALNLKNVSPYNVHDIVFIAEHVAEGLSVTWVPSTIVLLPSGQSCEMTPSCLEDNGDGTFKPTEGIIALLNAVHDRAANRMFLHLGYLRFTCVDKVNNRYQCSAELTFAPASFSFVIGAMERRLIS